MSKPSDYEMIAKWGKMMGSHKGYVEDQQALAAKENAPVRAIFRRASGVWVVADEVDSNIVRGLIGLEPKEEKTT